MSPFLALKYRDSHIQWPVRFVSGSILNLAWPKQSHRSHGAIVTKLPDSCFPPSGKNVLKRQSGP